MSTNLPGFQSFSGLLHHFVMTKFATSSIRVKGKYNISLSITDLSEIKKSTIWSPQKCVSYWITYLPSIPLSSLYFQLVFTIFNTNYTSILVYEKTRSFPVSP